MLDYFEYWTINILYGLPVSIPLTLMQWIWLLTSATNTIPFRRKSCCNLQPILRNQLITISVTEYHSTNNGICRCIEIIFMCISVFDKLISRTIDSKSFLFGTTQFSLWASGTVNYDFIVTSSINCLLIDSRCIPNGAHTNHLLSQFGPCFKTYQKLWCLCYPRNGMVYFMCCLEEKIVL